MKRRSRNILKWGGTVLTVLLLFVWVGSAWWSIGIRAAPSFVYLYGGGLYVAREPLGDTLPPQSRKELDFRAHDFRFYWWFQRDGDAVTGFWVVIIPLWVTILPVLAIVLWLWYGDRRRQPGLCVNCGYDLRGNASGVCPECGAAAS